MLLMLQQVDAEENIQMLLFLSLTFSPTSTLTFHRRILLFKLLVIFFQILNWPKPISLPLAPLTC